MIFYKYFPYSPLATILSLCCTLGGALALVFAINLFLNPSPLGIVAAVLLAAVGVFLFYLYFKKIDEIGGKWSEQNIRTKLNYAIRFCKEHPEAYEELSTLHPELGEKYEINEKGKLVKKKN